MKKSEVNKSAAIRDYAAANPLAKPREIAEALAAQGISVTPHIVSQVLYNAKKKGNGARPRKKAVRRAASITKAGGRRGKRAASDDFELLFEAKRLAELVGGIDRAKNLLDQLAKLRD